MARILASRMRCAHQLPILHSAGPSGAACIPVLLHDGDMASDQYLLGTLDEF